jgi:hypothetical protein
MIRTAAANAEPPFPEKNLCSFLANTAAIQIERQHAKECKRMFFTRNILPLYKTIVKEFSSIFSAISR